MKFVLLLAFIASLLITHCYAGQVCVENGQIVRCPYNELAQNSDVTLVSVNVPQTGFVPNNDLNGCVFNCEWFIRTARRNDPSKPCTLQRGRNGKFRSDCVQEQVCTKCKRALFMPKKPFYLSGEDTIPRCASFPEDLDAFTAAQLSTARDICRVVGECTCVSGDISPQVLSVRE